jgi:hypothetical protein
VIVHVAVNDLGPQPEKVGLPPDPGLVDSSNEGELLTLEELEAALHDQARPAECPVEVHPSRGMVRVGSQGAVELGETPAEITKQCLRPRPDVGQEPTFEVLDHADSVLHAPGVGMPSHVCTIGRGDHVGREALREASQVARQVDLDLEDMVDFVGGADLDHEPAPVRGVQAKVEVALARERSERAVEPVLLLHHA